MEFRDEWNGTRPRFWNPNSPDKNRCDLFDCRSICWGANILKTTTSNHISWILSLFLYFLIYYALQTISRGSQHFPRIPQIPRIWGGWRFPWNLPSTRAGVHRNLYTVGPRSLKVFSLWIPQDPYKRSINCPRILSFCLWIPPLFPYLLPYSARIPSYRTHPADPTEMSGVKVSPRRRMMVVKTNSRQVNKTLYTVGIINMARSFAAPLLNNYQQKCNHVQ